MGSGRRSRSKSRYRRSIAAALSLMFVLTGSSCARSDALRWQPTDSPLAGLRADKVETGPAASPEEAAIEFNAQRWKAVTYWEDPFGEGHVSPISESAKAEIANKHGLPTASISQMYFPTCGGSPSRFWRGLRPTGEYLVVVGRRSLTGAFGLSKSDETGWHAAVDPQFWDPSKWWPAMGAVERAGTGVDDTRLVVIGDGPAFLFVRLPDGTVKAVMAGGGNVYYPSTNKDVEYGRLVSAERVIVEMRLQDLDRRD